MFERTKFGLYLWLQMKWIRIQARIGARCLNNIELTLDKFHWNRQKKRQFWRDFAKSDRLREMCIDRLREQ